MVLIAQKYVQVDTSMAISSFFEEKGRETERERESKQKSIDIITSESMVVGVLLKFLFHFDCGRWIDAMIRLPHSTVIIESHIQQKQKLSTTKWAIIVATVFPISPLRNWEQRKELNLKKMR